MAFNQIDKMSRLISKTPRFFRILRTVGLAVTGVSVALLTAPIALPAGLVTLAGYLATAGAVTAAVSQATKEKE